MSGIKFDRMEKMLKKIMLVTLCCSMFLSANAQAETIQKTLSLGQWAFHTALYTHGQFVGYDGKCATIFRYYRRGTVRVYKGAPAHVLLADVDVLVRYDGGKVVYISYQK